MNDAEIPITLEDESYTIGDSVWGRIRGNLDDQSDLADALAQKADTSDVPTKLTDLENDGNFVQDADYVHTDNNYTDGEKSKLDTVQAGANKNVQSDWNETDTADDTYIKNKPTVPTKTSDLTNDSGFITRAGAPVQSVNGMTGDVVIPVGGNAEWGHISGDIDAQSDLAAALDTKVDKEVGKGLSTNDFTDADLAKLDGIEDGAEVNAPNTVIDADYVHTDNNFTDAQVTKLAGLSNYDDTAVRGLISEVASNLDSKQDKLTAGENITIQGNVISAQFAGPEIVELPDDKTSGTITSEQTEKLMGNNAVILHDGFYYHLMRRYQTGTSWLAYYICVYDGMIGMVAFEEVVLNLYPDGSQTSTWNIMSMS